MIQLILLSDRSEPDSVEMHAELNSDTDDTLIGSPLRSDGVK